MDNRRVATELLKLAAFLNSSILEDVDPESAADADKIQMNLRMASGALGDVVSDLSSMLRFMRLQSYNSKPAEMLEKQVGIMLKDAVAAASKVRAVQERMNKVHE